MENWLDKYSEDPKKKKPIYVESKNDPRYKAYQDSLSVYQDYSRIKKDLIKQKYNKDEFFASSSIVKKIRNIIGYDNPSNYINKKGVTKKSDNFYTIDDLDRGIINTSIKPQLFHKNMKPLGKEDYYDNNTYVPMVNSAPKYMKTNHNNQAYYGKDRRQIFNYSNVKPQQQVIVKPTTTKETTKPKPNTKKQVYSKDTPQVQGTEDLQPIGIENNFNINSSIPQIRQDVRVPKYYDVEDIVNNGKSQTNYQWYPENGEELRQLSTESGDKRKMVPHYQDGGNIEDAMRGMMKSKIGMGNAFNHPAIKRMSQAQPKIGMTPEGEGTHYMSSMDNYAVPLLQDKGNNWLDYYENPAPSSEDIRFDRPEDARYFAEHYKEVAPMTTIFKDIPKAQFGTNLTPKQAELKKQVERNNKKIETQNKFNEYQENKRKAADLENKKAKAKSNVQANMEEVYKSPLMSPGYFTPEGMAVGALQGAFKMPGDIAEGNTWGVVGDVAMMLPFAPKGIKAVRNILSKEKSFASKIIEPISTQSTKSAIINESNKLQTQQLAPPPSEIHFNADGTTRDMYISHAQPTIPTTIRGIDIRRPINGHAPGTPEWDRLNTIIYESNPFTQIDNALLNTPVGSPEWNRLQIRRQQLTGARSIGDEPWANQEYKPSIRNRSGLTKEQILENKNLKNKDDVSKMTEQDFQESVLKPTGEVSKYTPGTSIDEMTYDINSKQMVLKDASPLSVEEYSNIFNENIDELNKIIAKNNKSGVEYKAVKLNPRGALEFETPAGQKAANTTKRSIRDILNTDIREFGNIFRNQVDVPAGTRTWGVDIHPGKWTGEVQDIANAEYFKSIPGINMSNTTQGIFSDGVARRGTGAYESINEYLKQLNLGRVKPGFNSQTNYSKGLWENAVQKDKAFGYYNNLQTVYGSMKSVAPYATTGTLGAAAASQLDNQEEVPQYKQGGVIKDDRGQWEHPGEVTEIGSPHITMQGVNEPLIGISDTGHTQYMEPGKDYHFNGKKVTEFPLNKIGGWLDSFQSGGKIKDERLKVIKPQDNTYVKPTFTEANIKKPIKTEKEQRAKFNKLPKAQQERILYNQYAEQNGDIKPTENQSVGSKAWEVLTHPMTAAGYAARHENLPDNFSRGEINAHETATNLINPFFYADESKNFVKNVVTGHPIDASMNALNVLPIASEYKALGNLANKAGRFSKDISELVISDVKDTAKLVNQLGQVSTKPGVVLGNTTNMENPLKVFNTIEEGSNTIQNSLSNRINLLKTDEGRKRLIQQEYIAEVPEDVFQSASLDKFRGSPGMQTRGTTEHIPISQGKILQKDWLQGYKEVPKPKSGFKSEIDWGKWNKEIPDNPPLLKEYNTIEQTSKANGTWMKNPDGSAFKGTPEQFVQQNSSNFKKAFPEGSENVFRGTGENIAELRPNRSIFTANQELASGYAPFNKKSNFLNSESVEGGVHSFYRKNSKNSLELDANNTSWTSVDLSNKRLTKDYFERNIKSQEDQITKQKEYLSKMKQKPNGSWEAPDGTTYSNDLYKNTVGERELYLKDLKERYKNIDNLISNPKELEEMKKVLGNTTTTDDIAAYVEKRNLDYVKLKNIEDSGVGDVTIINHKPGNYLKSAIGNNGMFDMNNPNIYKSVLPIGLGLGAASQLEEKKNGGWLSKYEQGGVIKDDRGQWDHPGEITEIGSNQITMQGVPYPVLGVSKQTGEKKMMYPEKNYKFANTKQVVEYPLTDNNWFNKYE
jgi:hypothetical protein